MRDSFLLLKAAASAAHPRSNIAVGIRGEARRCRLRHEGGPASSDPMGWTASGRSTRHRSRHRFGTLRSLECFDVLRSLESTLIPPCARRSSAGREAVTHRSMSGRPSEALANPALTPPPARVLWSHTYGAGHSILPAKPSTQPPPRFLIQRSALWYTYLKTVTTVRFDV